MSLAGSHLEVAWRKDGRSKEYFDRARDVSRQVADQLGGEFLDTPIWHLNRVITVHPLGGCGMGRADTDGVVDAVFVEDAPGVNASGAPAILMALEAMK